MTDQRVNQRSVWISGTRMDDEPGRFVDDYQFVILVKHGQWNVFRQRGCRRGRRQGDGNPLARLQLAARLAHHSIAKRYLSVPDQRLYPASRQIGRKLRCQPLVDAQTGIRGIDGQLFQ